jgi:hypothetical protein
MKEKGNDLMHMMPTPRRSRRSTIVHYRKRLGAPVVRETMA